MSMNAAVVRSFDHPPRYEEYDLPVPSRPDEVVAKVLAAGLHPRVRTDASGRHYTSDGVLPMVPGIDGVGVLEDGRTVYFVTPGGAMAEVALVDTKRTVSVPENVDAAKVAAAMNPAMSSWVALRRRVPFKSGQSVLIMGATGNAGGMAIQIAKLLGAGRVVGAGRNPARLAELSALGADDVVLLTDDADSTARALAQAAADVDIVIDYLWGVPSANAMTALLTARADRSKSMDWIEIGAIAGPTIELPSVALRSANLRIQGVGQGAVSPEGYKAELRSLVEEIGAGRIEVNVNEVSLAEVEETWTARPVAGKRTVFVP
jgi:NADPH:quinone reductase-like Zn-dependent oxidoreductase